MRHSFRFFSRLVFLLQLAVTLGAANQSVFSAKERDLALTLLEVSRQAYQTPSTQTPWLERTCQPYKLWKTYSDPTYHISYTLYTSAQRKTVLVGFRGTSKQKLGNVLTDLKFIRVPCRLGLLDPTTPSTSTTTGCGTVHRGFQHAYMTIRQQLFTDLTSLASTFTKTSIRRIYFTGHSLGGALALLASLDLLRVRAQLALKLSLQGVITFGAPRVGDAAFEWTMQRQLKQAKVWHRRVVVQGDPVPLLPPRWAGYSDPIQSGVVLTQTEPFQGLKMDRGVKQRLSLHKSLSYLQLMKTMTTTTTSKEICVVF